MKLVSLLLALWMQIPATAPANAPIIDDVQVRGNRKQQNSSNSLKYVIQSKKGDRVNSAMIARDVRALYGREQFDDIWVEAEDTTPGHVILVFNVSEKPAIRNVDYKGLSTLQVSDVLKALSEKKATNDFIVAINQRLWKDIKYTIRMEPGMQTPEDQVRKYEERISELDRLIAAC